MVQILMQRLIFTVSVKSVLVIGQPIGGLIEYTSKSHDYQAVQSQTNLIIDPGYLTVDYVVASGLKIDVKRCGNVIGGVNRIIKHICEKIGKKYNLKYSNHHAVDCALPSGYLKYHGNLLPLDQYIRSAQPLIMQQITSMINTVGDVSDIDNIILVGGGAPLYLNMLRKIFNETPIRILPNNVYSNVSGFHTAGEKFMSGAQSS